MLLTERLEPENFHASLHQWVGVGESIPFDLGQNFRRKFKLPHPCVLARQGIQIPPPSLAAAR